MIFRGDIRYTIETSLFSTNVIINDVKENDVGNAAGRSIASQMPTLRLWLSLRSRVTHLVCQKILYFDGSLAHR